MEKIKPLIDYGHLNFGENKVQEAIDKWKILKNNLTHLELHLIGKLQTNKVRFAVPLFDYIHSLDNLRLAEKISIEQKKINRNLKIFIQVNIGDEIQKGGISIDQLDKFYFDCTNKYKLNIVGLMCIPPNTNNNEFYFKKMLLLKNKLGLKELSMGMSSDYLSAINFGSTYVRIGSKIFGSRN